MSLGQILIGYKTYLLHIANEDLDDHLRNRVAPSDIVQQTFMDAGRDIASFSGENADDFRKWLCGILHNNLRGERDRNGAEKRAATRDIPLPDQTGKLALHANSPSPSSELVQQEEATTLRDAMEQLPSHYRQAIELHDHQNLSFEEVGAVMDCTAEAARKYRMRGLVILQRILEPDHDS